MFRQGLIDCKNTVVAFGRLPAFADSGAITVDVIDAVTRRPLDAVDDNGRIP